MFHIYYDFYEWTNISKITSQVKKIMFCTEKLLPLGWAWSNFLCNYWKDLILTKSPFFFFSLTTMTYCKYSWTFLWRWWGKYLTPNKVKRIAKTCSLIQLGFTRSFTRFPFPLLNEFFTKKKKKKLYLYIGKICQERQQPWIIHVHSVLKGQKSSEWDFKTCKEIYISNENLSLLNWIKWLAWKTW